QAIGNEGGHPVTLSGGEDTFLFDYTFSVARLHEIKAVLESDNDSVVENNTYYSFVYIEGSSNRVLILDGTGSESATLAQFLDGDYNYEIMNVADIPLGNYGFINMFDEIILMNVANNDLPVGFDDALKHYVEVIGGGLFTTGGTKAYQEDDMA